PRAMKFKWNKKSEEKMTLKKFLKNKGVSHRTLSSLKKGNGKVLVDGKKRSLSIEVGKGKITLILPPEKSDENVKISKEPLDIIYEDSNWRSEEHTSELQSRFDLVCRLLLEKKKKA